MKLTNRSEYALLALAYLAKQPLDSLVHAEEISAEQEIPTRFLQQILFILKRAKLVKSVKGKRGGYALSKPAAQITIAEVVRLFEGALAPTSSASRNFYEPSPIEKEKGLLRLFKQIRFIVAEKLENTTLDQVCN